MSLDRFGEVVAGVGVGLPDRAVGGGFGPVVGDQAVAPVAEPSRWYRRWAPWLLTSTARPIMAAPDARAVCSARAMRAVPAPWPGGRASRAFISGKRPSTCRTPSYLETASTVPRPASSSPRQASRYVSLARFLHPEPFPVVTRVPGTGIIAQQPGQVRRGTWPDQVFHPGAASAQAAARTAPASSSQWAASARAVASPPASSDRETPATHPSGRSAASEPATTTDATPARPPPRPAPSPSPCRSVDVASNRPSPVMTRSAPAPPRPAPRVRPSSAAPGTITAPQAAANP